MKIKEIILSLSVLGITSVGIIGLIDKDTTKKDIITANMDNIILLAAGEATGADTKNIYVAYGPDTLENESEWSQYGHYIEEDIYASYGSNVNIDDWKTSVTFKDLPQPKWGCHKFEGWFTEQNYNLANGGTVTSSGSEILSTTYVATLGDQRLYAHWSEWHPSTYYEKTSTTHTLRCSICDEKVEETNLGGYKVIDEGRDGVFSSNPTGNHTYTTSNSSYYKAPTCTSTGWKKCTTVSSEGTICGYVSTISALGHDYDSYYTTDTEPTCTSSGWESKHCSRCSSTTGGRSISALGHDWSEYISETCTSSATDKCSRCGSTTTGDGATGHSWYEYRSETCTSSATDKCSNCGSTRTGDSATGHSYNSSGKCTYCGDQKYSSCSCCGGNEYTCSCSGWCYSCSNCNSHCICSDEEDDDTTIGGGGSTGGGSTCDGDCTSHMHSIGNPQTDTCYCGATYTIEEYVCDDCDVSQGYFITGSGCSHISVEV